MKVSDRQWSVGDVLRLALDNPDSCRVVVALNPNHVKYPIQVEDGDGENRQWCNANWEVELVREAPRPPPTIEQRAARLAEVYRAADAAAYGVLKGYEGFATCEGTLRATHEIAMLLVKRELEAEGG